MWALPSPPAARGTLFDAVPHVHMPVATCPCRCHVPHCLTCPSPLRMMVPSLRITTPMPFLAASVLPWRAQKTTWRSRDFQRPAFMVGPLRLLGSRLRETDPGANDTHTLPNSSPVCPPA